MFSFSLHAVSLSSVYLFANCTKHKEVEFRKAQEKDKSKDQTRRRDFTGALHFRGVQSEQSIDVIELGNMVNEIILGQCLTLSMMPLKGDLLRV